MRSRIASIENLISQDPARRNIFSLVQRDHLRLAALSLLRAERVIIVSGFPIPQAGAGETDGPAGTWALGRALMKLNIPVAYLTDSVNLPLFKALGAGPILSRTPTLLEEHPISHLVAIERPGRARDGRYYNMRGDELTEYIEPLDDLFLDAETRGLVTIGIGDGGNEIGMGRVFRQVSKSIYQGGRIASTILTDYVIAAGISNWGAYGLVGALSVLVGRDLLPTVHEMTWSIQAIVEAGAVDGVTGRRTATVDGLPVARSVKMLQEIRWHIPSSPIHRVQGLTAAVIGAGESGRAAARLLLKHEAEVRISDHRPVDIPDDLRRCRWERGGHHHAFLENVKLVVRSPGVPPDHPVLQRLQESGVPVLSELELAYELGRPIVAAVTGSRGKWSTVGLLGRLMRSSKRPLRTGGNKGTPLSQLLLTQPDCWYGLAVSSFQLESIIRFRPHAAVILNVRRIHQDRHHDIAETLRIKSRVFMNQGAEDLLVLNYDDPLLRDLGDRHWGETAFVSSRCPVERGAWIEGGEIFLNGDQGIQALGPGPECHTENLLSAVVVSHFMGLRAEELRDGLVDLKRDAMGQGDGGRSEEHSG